MTAPADDPIVLVAPDPRWPAQFAAAAAEIADACGAHVVAIEHVGSTSVAGLVAKPILDILVGTPSVADADACVPLLTARGYVYDRRWEDELPDRRLFVLHEHGHRVRHVHAVPIGSWFWIDDLAFREALRADDALRDAYAELKRGLALEFATDRVGYTNAKGPFIRAVLERAKAAAAQG